MNITPASHHPASDRRPFTSVFDYAATGENLRQHVFLVNATNASDARRRHYEALAPAPEYWDWHNLAPPSTRAWIVTS